MRRLFLICNVVILTLMPLHTAHAALRLETWKSYGAMAEQGGVCAAFARLMELQSKIDAKRGKLWFERRKFAGTLIRQASVLEGLPSVEQNDIDALINSYASWLIANLNNQNTKQIMDDATHNAATKMINDVCSGLYARADDAILQTHRHLATCPIAKTAKLPTCKPAFVTKPTKITATNTTQDAQELTRARDEIAMLTMQNESLRAKLRKMRAPSLEFEMKVPSENTDASLKENFDKVTTDHSNVLASQAKAKNKTSFGIETDNDAVTSLAGRHKHTTPDINIMLPDESAKPNEVTTEDKITKSPMNTNEIRKRNISNLFVAQLGSYASSQQANDGMHYLKATFETTFKRLELSVVSKTLRSGQRVYDLVTEKSERTEIEEICNSLWEHRFGCFVTSVN
ncbi:hypothetical protein N9X12_02535 [Alphaproteobacteria bacterium]|nr:hypothetical protein [Alphaproteobacteria bacterium]